ncbi:hypothetical protein NQ318_013056 [Aromia moschata]|uniref:Uncharacterized protein n=1 Tax=Aromia moschata TaxID=1265417 RepID=A0AAV8X4N2_9CUCU|nr:hypothetical protein NQ318_013056 [Aromia moschata]
MGGNRSAWTQDGRFAPLCDGATLFACLLEPQNLGEIQRESESESNGGLKSNDKRQHVDVRIRIEIKNSMETSKKNVINSINESAVFMCLSTAMNERDGNSVHV